MVLTQSALFLGGLAALVYGADRAVRAGAKLALLYGVSTFFVGVTVVSVGTSVPEMTTSIVSARIGAGELLVGNILGSEVAQITIGIGIVALIQPFQAERSNVAIYGSAMMLAMVIMILVLEDGELIRSEAFLMVFSYLFFLYHLYTAEGGEEVGQDFEEEIEEEAEKSSRGRLVAWLVFGLVLVGVGGQLMVTNGVRLANALGVPQLLIGLITGLGTTIPEIVIASMAAWKGDPGISVGSLLGSNITDPVFSLGVGGLAGNVVLGSPGSFLAPASYMLAVSLAVLVAMWIGRGIKRPVAVACVLLYAPVLVL